MYNSQVFLPPYGATDGVVTDWWNYTTIQFAANAAGYADFAYYIPSNFIRVISVEAVWSCVVAAGNMYWRFTARYGASGQSIAENDEAPAYGLTATGGSLIFNIQEPADPLSLPLAALGDVMTIRFDRDGTDVSDTLNNPLYLHGVVITYIAQRTDPGIYL